MSHDYYYECATCGRRVFTTSSTRVCPSCRGPLQNLAVPRE